MLEWPSEIVVLSMLFMFNKKKNLIVYARTKKINFVYKQYAFYFVVHFIFYFYHSRQQNHLKKKNN